MDTSSEFQFRLVNTFLVTCLVLSALLAWLEFRSYQDQSRRVYVMHLYDEWRRLLDLGEARPTLERIRSGQLNSADLVRQQGEYELGEGADAITYDKVLEMRQHVVSVLNLFEQVAVAARDDVGDSGMIENYFSAAIVDHFTALTPFVSGWQSGLGRAPAWRVLERAVEGWRDPPAGDP